MSENRTVSSELSRDLSLFHVTMMGLGMMIGAGVFVGISLSVQGAGPGGLLLTMGLNGLLALFSAMSFAELASAIPRAGGAYNFARVAFGRGPSFLAGWMEWLASSVAGGFYAIVFASFTMRFLNEAFALGLSEAWLNVCVRLLAVGAAGVFIAINYRGSSETGKIGAIFTVGQMLFVLAIAVAGIVVTILHPERLRNFTPFMHPDGWVRLLGTMGVIYVAFEGFEVIAQAGDETVDPKRNLPKAMLYSVLVVTITYLLVAFASVMAITPAAIEGEPAAGTVRQWFEQQGSEIAGFAEAIKLLMPYGGVLVTLAVLFSATSALNATIYSATRASYALGRDRLLPGLFATISHTRKTPVAALGFTSILVLAVAVLLSPKDASATASMTFLSLFFVVNLCVIRVRRHMGDELDYGYLMPLFPLIPILAIIGQVALAGGILMESVPAWVVAASWITLGVGVYLGYSRTRAAPTAEEIRVLEERPAPVPVPTGAAHRTMVAVANPYNALELVQTTHRICGVRGGSIELIHMVPVPDQVPLSDASRYMLEGREGLLEAMLSLGLQYPVSTTIRYCRSMARGIVSAVREKRIGTLILGWHGRAAGGLFTLGSTVDPVIERSPCDVVVLKNCGGNRVFRNVLVPLAGGPNGALALEIATILADPDAGCVTPFTVMTGRHLFDIEAFVNAHADRLRLPRQRVQSKAVGAQDVVAAILEEAKDYDLVVIGSTHEAAVRHMRTAPIPETVAQRCDLPLVMVRASGGIRSWIRRYV